MMRNLPALIIIFPLVSALLSVFLSKIRLYLGRNLVITSIFISLVLSIVQLREVILNGPISYKFGNYVVPYGIEFKIDTINAIMLVMICIIGLLTGLFSTNFEENSKDRIKIGGSHALTALLCVGMLGMTSTGDVFNLYVFLEVTSLSGYVLIALGGSKGVVSAFRYLLMGTVAATFYLLGVAMLYSVTGTLNMQDMHDILSSRANDDTMLIAMCMFIVAFGIKMALFPFHGWQPSAYTHAQTGARPLIAGVMGKIPAYAMFRYLYCVYGTEFKYFRYFLIVIGTLSVMGMIYGSVRAMAQTDIRKMLAYSSVAQISYITLGFAIGTPIAIAGSFLHMFGHAFMKGGLFFASGSIRYKYGIVDMNDFGYIYKKMPLTSALLSISALSMIGIPPTVGFFSKWYLALGAAGEREYIYIAILVISSLLNAIYFFKMIEKIFMAKDRDLKSIGKDSVMELPWTMMIPILISILMILGLGLFNVKIINILLMSLGGIGI